MSLGKIGKLNQKEHRELNKLWLAKDTFFCEFPEPHDCNGNIILSNAHRHKKRWYLGRPVELRWSFTQVIRICSNAHDLIEYNAPKTASTFIELRGEEIT